MIKQIKASKGIFIIQIESPEITQEIVDQLVGRINIALQEAEQGISGIFVPYGMTLTFLNRD